MATATNPASGASETDDYHLGPADQVQREAHRVSHATDRDRPARIDHSGPPQETGNRRQPTALVLRGNHKARSGARRQIELSGPTVQQWHPLNARTRGTSQQPMT